MLVMNTRHEDSLFSKINDVDITGQLARIVKEKKNRGKERPERCPQSRQLPPADFRGVWGKLGGQT
jgi:hypothetical protein